MNGRAEEQLASKGGGTQVRKDIKQVSRKIDKCKLREKQFLVNTCAEREEKLKDKVEVLILKFYN